MKNNFLKPFILIKFFAPHASFADFKWSYKRLIYITVDSKA